MWVFYSELLHYTYYQVASFVMEKNKSKKYFKFFWNSAAFYENFLDLMLILIATSKIIKYKCTYIIQFKKEMWIPLGIQHNTNE